ncbi:hypothetical protein GK047_19660 [Paenibacillus sp. SYP-B3998]|uniref:Uncharacterized protein n=1 Tax=Paenibacillus sp. SYP-B3998 TaxID=2678564 RepID=A0A6G4A324_9BACL|nr:hypothetical protein [Paenibacillus sp. SYP-B3998]NEW08221.1 hypothetical protein [Paenibacillus sp. SYP-B3998]
MSKNVKNLSVAVVKKQNAQMYKDKKTIHFENAKLLVDIVFRPSKKSLVIAEMLDVLKEAMLENQKIDSAKGIALSTMLIIKHFTSIETDAQGYNGLLDMLVQLNDGEYTPKIIESFEQIELEKMFSELSNSMELVKKQLDNDFGDTIKEAEANRLQ